MRKMKKWLVFTCAIMLVSMLAACGSEQEKTNSGEDVSVDSTAGNGTTADAYESTVKAVEAENMPVIMIETKEQGDNAMDFVTMPVAPLVSRQVATWTPNYVTPPAPYYVDCIVSVQDSEGTMVLENADAKVKVRGNWTTNYDKKPLGIKFESKQNLLGLNKGRKYKNWILLAEYKDGSMLRNKTALSIANEILAPDGLYTPDAKLVTVKINNKYWGVYLLCEQLQVNKGRIDITEADKDYTGTDIGYFLEFDGYFYEEDDLHGFHVSYADNASLTPYDGNGGSGRTIKCLPENAWDEKSDVGFSIKSDIYSMEQHDFIADYVDNVYRIMYEAAYNNAAYVFTSEYKDIKKLEDGALTPEAAVRRVVNIDSLADMYIISELTCDADIYWSSFYMSADFGLLGDKRLTFQAPWDFDSAMGNKSRCPDGTGYYAANIVPDVNGGPAHGGSYETINPWLAVLANEEWFMNVVKDKWTRAYEDGVFRRGITMVEEDAVRYKAEFVKNYGKWHNLANNSAFVNELAPRAAECKTEAKAAEYLGEWLKARVEFMNSYLHR